MSARWGKASAFSIRHLLNAFVPAPSQTFSGARMNLEIVLDDKSFHSLKQSMPKGSRSNLTMEKAFHLKRFGSNAVIICDAAEARTLLLYAGHCPGVTAPIHRALREAGLPLDPPTGE